MMSKLKYGCEGLVAVISGGTSGIGLAAAAKLAADGARVYILGRSRAKGEAAVRQLQEAIGAAALRRSDAQTQGEAFFVPCDVSKAASCKEAVAKIGEREKSLLREQQAHIDILINSAGVYAEQRLENMTEADYSAIMDTNVKGTLLLTQACLPLMYSGGSIINIASDAGVSGNYGCPVYCASKGAVVSLTRALALDLAPQIRVNCICPADVDTPLLARQLVDANGGYTLADMAASYPLGRIGRAEEIAHVICSVASPANSFMTGSIITVDGGITAG
ncbi:MAG: SDR family oxidoreductase [Phascolarctobacterium sp.]|nr:SDR family oxidoreductase [Phascolarctobacterium sp.]